MKKEHIIFKVSPEEKAEIRLAAKDQCRSISGFFRWLLFEYLKKKETEK